MTPHYRKTGFTLIELLIVVAIIAILAAIAVPNFLEAQVRAKVSRVKGDLRTIATAEEAYRLEWDSYTHINTGSDHPEGSSRQWGGLRELTTPVAYLTTIPSDPFGMSYYTTTAGNAHRAVYEIGSGIPGVGGAGRPWGADYRGGMPSTVYEVESDGPDHWDDTNVSPYWTSQFPWPTVQGNTAAAISQMSAMCYDPTNGTVSVGEIYRVGGQKMTGGMAHDVFWTNGSR
ncbi:prepilin-type N-terminal cleavage/methylation domain-containing protein [Candidatus Sumerlaeota bacterium]|nr:prepilin-type N-terminal cleavage/methylation domain-containing protein [Candidatus Sumerlaeota bacterium]